MVGDKTGPGNKVGDNLRYSEGAHREARDAELLRLTLSELRSWAKRIRLFGDGWPLVDQVLGGVDQSRCKCIADTQCDDHYHAESADIASGRITNKTPHPLIREWTIRGFVRYRAEVWDADNVPSADPEGWLREFGLDDFERGHLELRCADTCPMCTGDSYYIARISGMDEPVELDT